MASNEKLDSWILKHADCFNLQVESNTWTEKWLPGFFDVRSFMTVMGETFEGTGIDSDERAAFYKSFSEVIERIFCRFNNIGSNGVSAHLGRDASIFLSQNELFERASFQAFSQGEIQSVPIENEKIKEIVKSMKNILSVLGVDIQFIQVNSIVPEFTLFIARSTRISGDQSFVGLGHDLSVEESFIKSLQECLVNVVADLAGKSLSRTEQKSCQIFLDEKDSCVFESRRSGKGKRSNQGEASVEVKSRRLSCPIQELNNVPLFVFQSYFHFGDQQDGDPIKSKINQCVNQ